LLRAQSRSWLMRVRREVNTVDRTTNHGPKDDDWLVELLTRARDGGRLSFRDDSGAEFVILSQRRYDELQASAQHASPHVRLTERERQILEMISEGAATAVLGDRLGLAQNTVAQHLSAVRRKYGVTSSAAAVAVARRAGAIA
jgi:DNA-binding CsgD family transcriptional regulator